jgi:BirA family biotin operon repressor/biotin-[acetyl-CoA-carboxylase] ligase
MAHIPMLAGLAITDAVIDVTRLPVSLKWPNDVLCRDHKVCGILTESATGCVILGIGINVNLDPTEYGFPETATTLEKELGRAVSREDLAVALFKRLDIWYRSLTQGPSLVYGAWAARLSTVGSRVQVVDRQGTWQGVATGVRRDGGLIVRRADGQVDTVYAADVSIRRTQDFTSQ